GERAIVLSAASQTILDTLGVWSTIAPFTEAVKKVHVSDRGHFGAVRLSADEEGVSALGYVVQAKFLDAQIANAMQADVSVCYGATFVKIEENHNDVTLRYLQNNQEISVKTNLVVAADGQNSALRAAVGIEVATTVYEQSAIVSVIDLARSHQNIAYERFTLDGPLAFLPLRSNQAALVWTVPARDQDAILTLSPEQFLDAIQNKFGYRLGKFLSATSPAAFPIVMKRACELVKRRTVIIGNAANSIHPIAGQGLNLGLRDAAVLADLLQQNTANGLDEYVKRRQADHRDIVAITHNLVGIFSNAFLPLVVARSMGLVAMELLSPIKKWLSKRTMGYAGFATPLVCGVLEERYEQSQS
ncbi:MAG: FAD-dependent monooxygenase, partial [Pseudomonadota bacterium]|nr:FAD-dependent monooxygenase [Pseudomonadota bacterium]